MTSIYSQPFLVKTPRKEKPMLIKLPYGAMICVLSFTFYPSKVFRWKSNRVEMLSDGICRYTFVEWNPTGSMGTQKSPSMSVGITGLVVNLTSHKCSINEICLVLKARKRNSSFQARMTWLHTLFFNLKAKQRFTLTIAVSVKYGPFFKLCS